MARSILEPAAGLALALVLAAGLAPTRAAADTLADTTVADFNAGTPGACYVAETTNGEVLLPPTVGAEFFGTSSYPTPPAAGWTSWLWCTHNGSQCPESGSAEVAGGSLSLLRALARTDAGYAPDRSLEFVATFAGPAGSAAIFQHVGFGSTGDSGATEIFNAAPWAIFSVPTDSAGVNVRVLASGSPDDGDPVCANFPTPGTCPCNDGMGNNTTCLDETHRYRIDWTSTQLDFSVDGTLVHHETAKTITDDMRPGASHLNTGSTALVVDWMRMTPYTSPCTFQSRVFDAGSAATSWDSLTATSALPIGTALDTLETRTGNTATPDGTWSGFAALSGTTIGSPAARYLQYQATLSSSEASQSPELQQVDISFAALPSPTPTHTPVPPTSTATATPSRTAPRTATPRPTPPSHACRGDVDGNGHVGLNDLVLVARALFSTPGRPRWNPAADLNHNGIVDPHDLLIVLLSLADPQCR